MVLPLPFHSLVRHCAAWYTFATVAIHWQKLHGKLWGWRTQILCTSSLSLLKKVVVQPYICMGGPTRGLTPRPPWAGSPGGKKMRPRD